MEVLRVNNSYHVEAGTSLFWQAPHLDETQPEARPLSPVFDLAPPFVILKAVKTLPLSLILSTNN